VKPEVLFPRSRELASRSYPEVHEFATSPLRCTFPRSVLYATNRDRQRNRESGGHRFSKNLRTFSKILGPTVKNLVVTVAWSPRFVHPCHKYIVRLLYYCLYLGVTSDAFHLGIPTEILCVSCLPWMLQICPTHPHLFNRTQ